MSCKNCLHLNHIGHCPQLKDMSASSALFAGAGIKARCECRANDVGQGARYPDAPGSQGKWAATWKIRPEDEARARAIMARAAADVAPPSH